MLDMQLQDQTETNIYCVTSFCRFTINQRAPEKSFQHNFINIFTDEQMCELNMIIPSTVTMVFYN